jgi:hypothetical protein
VETTRHVGHRGSVADDDVVIGAGTTVDINTTPLTMNSLTVNGTLEYDATLRAVTVTTNAYIAPGGTLQTNPTGAQTGHTLSVGGKPDERWHARSEHVRQHVRAPTDVHGCGEQHVRRRGRHDGSPHAHHQQGRIERQHPGDHHLDAFRTGYGSRRTPMAFLTITNGTLKISGPLLFAGRTFTCRRHTRFTPPADSGSTTRTTPDERQAGLTVAWADPGGSGHREPGTRWPPAHSRQGTLIIGTSAKQFDRGLRNNYTSSVEGGAINTPGASASTNCPRTTSPTLRPAGCHHRLCTVVNTSRLTLASFDLGSGLGPDVVMSGGTVTVRINTTGTGPFRDYPQSAGQYGARHLQHGAPVRRCRLGRGQDVQRRGAAAQRCRQQRLRGPYRTVSSGRPSSNNTGDDVTINPGCTFDIGNQVYLERGNTVTNDGTLSAKRSVGPASSGSRPGGSGTYQGAGVTTGVLSSWETQAANLTMSQVRR